uniref:Putative ovule protein n=1 Tax=Solanum chacoense TaxID=4108 RepID=A0A0V0HHA5_SOLCH
MVVYDLLYYLFKFVLDITFAFAILEPNITYAGPNNMFYSKNLLIFFHHILLLYIQNHQSENKCVRKEK